MRYTYIFDFDGVLVNTMPAHFAAYRQALAEVHVPVDEKMFYSQAGKTGREQLRHFITMAGAEVDLEQVYARTRQILRTNPLPMEGIACNLELLSLLRQAGIRLAIATGSSRARILPLLADHGIVVDVLVTAEDVQQGKPAPDLFLYAAEKLGVAPRDCVVVEDSEAGIQAAQSAGMQVLHYLG